MIHKTTAILFIKARDKNKRQVFLSPLTRNELVHCYLDSSGMAGYALSADNELVNLFNNGRKGIGSVILSHAIRNNKVHLNCFDGFLCKYYQKHGFKIVKRIKFNDKYAPKDWNYELYGRPDVVFMKR